jgi:hypothetical protein
VEVFCRLSAVLSGLMLLIVAGGCAAPRVQVESTAADFRDRLLVDQDGGVRVSTSVLSAEESFAQYGFPLAEHGVQPVWVEVENAEDRTYWLMSPGMDPNFFPASEVADIFAPETDREATTQRFRDLAFRNPVPPGSTVSGFVLTHLDEGVKMVQVDLLASGRLKSFALLNDVPGFRADYRSKQVFLRELYAAEEVVDYLNDDDFRTALSLLPCCVTNRKGTRDGDPLNLVIVGGVQDAFPALVRRGWHPTEETWSGSVMRMVKSALSGERYRYAPVSPLYLFGRPQDLALQKARDNIHQRNHLRLWKSPMRYRGKPVWVGQISRDIGSRLTIHSPYLTTHKIDPDVDEARTALVEDMAYSQNLYMIGMVHGVGAAPRTAPRANLTTDPYFTDGLRAVLVFGAYPKSLTEIEFAPWESDWADFVGRSSRKASQ